MIDEYEIMRGGANIRVTNKILKISDRVFKISEIDELEVIESKIEVDGKKTILWTGVTIGFLSFVFVGILGIVFGIIILLLVFFPNPKVAGYALTAQGANTSLKLWSNRRRENVEKLKMAILYAKANPRTPADAIKPK